ncbi:energy-coupling factor transporter ATPase [Patescibacteria group bacterium]|nr:energy-coupling factor transporter ATPase [Patescibacteria group bacterium]
MSTPEEIFRLNALSYQYDQTNSPALRDVNCHIQAGEAVGIIGESGGGKTTALNLLSGIIPHMVQDGKYEGEALFRGASIQHLSIYDLMRHVKIVFQDASTQNFGLNVDDALAFGMENIALSPKEIEYRIKKIADELNITHLRAKNTQQLSGGERQRVAIASALAMDPEVLLLDEAISALDTGGQMDVRQIVEQQRASGKTMVLVDSDVRWLAKTVDRVLVLQSGQLIYDGPPQVIFQRADLAEAAGLENHSGEIQFREPFTGSPVVQLSHISFAYSKDTPVLKDISLNITAGSCEALVGQNGSGKTTLAKIIAGLIKPSAGEVFINGQVPYNLTSPRLVENVGYVFQNPSQQFVDETVKEEFSHTASILKRPPAVSLKDFDLENYADSSPWDLSAGQQQRLAIASVVATNPSVVIFDEPTLGQTRRDREKLVATIKNLQQQGTTVVIISHDLKFIADAAQHVHVIDHGELRASGAAPEILQDKSLFNHLGLPLPW